VTADFTGQQRLACLVLRRAVQHPFRLPLGVRLGELPPVPQDKPQDVGSPGEPECDRRVADLGQLGARGETGFVPTAASSDGSSSATRSETQPLSVPGPMRWRSTREAAARIRAASYRAVSPALTRQPPHVPPVARSVFCGRLTVHGPRPRGCSSPDAGRVGRRVRRRRRPSGRPLECCAASTQAHEPGAGLREAPR
jgi:hypothetical protein